MGTVKGMFTGLIKGAVETGPFTVTVPLSVVVSVDEYFRDQTR
jgi:hypothetical protein